MEHTYGAYLCMEHTYAWSIPMHGAYLCMEHIYLCMEHTYADVRMYVRMPNHPYPST